MSRAEAEQLVNALGEMATALRKVTDIVIEESRRQHRPPPVLRLIPGGAQ